MRAEELTISDWFSFNGEDGQIGIIDNWDGEVSYFNGDAEGILTFGFDDINPITLTAEILKKNGFTQVKNEKNTYHKHLKDGYISVYIEKENAYIHYHNHECDSLNIKIRYVHELQHALRLFGLVELANNFKI